jgi:hypothetical protein
MKWKASHFGEGEHRREVVLDENCGQVCEVIDRGDKGEQAARLMAAAPELLEKLKGIIRYAGYETGEALPTIDQFRIHRSYLDKARQAVAKAEGKQP